jgi:hypothetical protein
MVALPVEGDVFIADKPSWSEAVITRRPRQVAIDLHPDATGSRWPRVRAETSTKQDKVVLIFNFFDGLRRIVPTTVTTAVPYRIEDLTMRHGLRSQFAPLDRTSSRRNTVMCACAGPPAHRI